VRITFISPFPIFPTHGGNRARTLTLIKSLRENGHQISFVLLDSRQLGDCEESRHRSFFGEKNFFFLRRNLLFNFFYYLLRSYRIILRSAKRRFAQTGFRSVDEIYYPPFTRQLKKIHAQLSADIVVVEYVHFSKAFDAFNNRVYKILDVHDSSSDLLTASEEAKGFRRAHAILAIQSAEAELFRLLLGEDADRVQVVSHLLDLNGRVDNANTEGVTFVGSSFDANIVSLKYFIDEVLPLIVTKIPSFKLFVAGSICKDIADQPSIKKLGQVDTLSAAFKAAPISVNPIRKGTGVKIKLLESMSLGVPAVSTEFGVQGIDSTFLGGVVRVSDDDARGFADAVIELTMDSSLRRRLGECGYTCAVRWNESQLTALEMVLTEAENFIARAKAAPGATF
jgi:glycosyltransferase involved in cell wall biosynthesis